MEDAEEYLGDADEMRGYLDRPIGETVARLCAALGLDPEACESDGETWRVRRPPARIRTVRMEERARKFSKPDILPPAFVETGPAEARAPAATAVCSP